MDHIKRKDGRIVAEQISMMTLRGKELDGCVVVKDKYLKGEFGCQELWCGQVL